MGVLSFVTYYGYCHSLDGFTLFSKVDSNKLRINVKNKMTLIVAKFDADLINISEVTSRKIKWPRLFGLPCRWRTRAQATHAAARLTARPFWPGRCKRIGRVDVADRTFELCGVVIA